MKYRPDPEDGWKTVVLGKDPRLTGPRPPAKPPQSVLDRAHEFSEAEYRAKHGLARGPARAKGLDGYVAAYLESFALGHKAGSLKQARRHLASFVAFVKAAGVATVQGVTRSHCRDYLDARSRSVSHDTLQTEVGYLAPLWARAVEDDIIPKNPWTRIKIPGKSTRSDPVHWTTQEVARIAAACAKAWQSDLVILLVNTGLRISTALAMRWSWVDFGASLIRIPPEAAAKQDGIKTSYTAVIDRKAREVLERRRFTEKSGDGDLVFRNPYGDHGLIPYDSAREAIARAIERAGVKPGTPHDLRHTFARIVSETQPSHVVQSMLGHSTAATTRIYTGLSPEDIARRLEDFGIGDVEVTPGPSGRDPLPG